MSSYKFEIGQRVINMDLIEGEITDRYIPGNNKQSRYEINSWKYFNEDELMRVMPPEAKYAKRDWVWFAEGSYGNGRSGQVYNSRYNFTTKERTYTIDFSDGRRGERIPESFVTKIEHTFRPGDRVYFDAGYRGAKTDKGTVTKIALHGVTVKHDDHPGEYSRSIQQVTKIADLTPVPDLPLPPKLDTLKTTTITTTFTDVNPEAFKLLTGGMEFNIAPKPMGSTTGRYTKTRVQKAKDELDKQIEDAEAELKKLKAARAKLVGQ